MALPPAFDPIVNAPRWQKVVLGAMLLVMILAGGYFLVLSPVQTRLAALRAQRASLQTELVTARAQMAQLARIRREAAELEKRLETLKAQLPTEKEMPPLFRSLTDHAFQAGLAVSLFQPREGKIRDFYVEFPITVSAEASFHELGEFFARVATLARVVTVAEVKLTALAQTRHPIRADLTLATYTYRPEGAPPAPKAPTKR